jgi:uncharacterized membrane protein YwaF
MNAATLILGGTFVLFSGEHWAVLGLIAAITTVLSRVLRRTAGGPHALRVCRGVCWSLAGTLVLGAIVGQLHRVTDGVWTLKESLPLHLCDIAVGIVAAALVGVGLHGPARVMAAASRRKGADDAVGVSSLWQRLYELAFIWGMGGTSQAILTPDVWGAFPEVTCVRYFILHGGIVVSVLVMTIGLKMRPLPGAVRRVWLTTLVLALVVFPIDWAVGANYMYLMGRPTNPTIIDLFGPWPWSLIPLVLVGTAFIVLCYVPFWVIDRCRGCRKSVLSEPPAQASDSGLGKRERSPALAARIRDPDSDSRD